MNLGTSIGKEFEDGKFLKFLERLIHSTWITIPSLIIIGIAISFCYAFVEMCYDIKRYATSFCKNTGSIALFLLKYKENPDIE